MPNDKSNCRITRAVGNDELRRRFVKLHESLNDEITALEQETLQLNWIVSVNAIYAEQTSNLHNERRLPEPE